MGNWQKIAIQKQYDIAQCFKLIVQIISTQLNIKNYNFTLHLQSFFIKCIKILNFNSNSKLKCKIFSLAILFD